MFSIPMNLSRTVRIEKPIEEVFAAVADFQTWSRWSPWLCQEPDCRVKIQGPPAAVGHGQEWDGQFIGAGRMALVDLQPGRSLRYDLHFLKPWKSHSRVEFHFQSKGQGTEVTWTMEGQLPIFMFFFKKMMVAFVGSDYQRGLSMLKEYVETGKVLSRVDVKGIVARPGFHYVGKRTQCGMADLGSAMAKDFAELQKLADEGTLPKPEFSGSLYHKFDMVKGQVEYTALFSYKQPVTAPRGLESGHAGDHQALEVDHHGPYRHLGNAWTTAFGRQRAMKKKADKGLAAYEIYKTLPGAVTEDKVLTEIFLPVRP